jgi:hypothetical protein
MSALLRLYPRSWRERYEREFLGLLEARPPSLGDRVDIVRGAVDARLNLGAPHETDRSSRVTAAAAIAGGSLWVAWLLVGIRNFDALETDPLQTAGRFLSLVAGLTLAAGHVSLGLASMGRMRLWGAVAASIATIGFVITAFGAGSAAPIALGGSAALAAAVGGRTLHTLVAALWLAAIVGVFGAFAGLAATQWEDPSVMLQAVPYGIVWILIGGTIAVRGLPRAAVEGPNAGSGG